MKKMLHRREVRFLLVGGILFVVDYTVSVAAFYLLSVPAGLASALGFMASFIIGFTLNRSIVFAHSEKSKFSVHAQVSLYLTLALANMFISATFVQVSDNLGIKIQLSKPLITAVIAVWNYLILGKYIFQSKNM